MYFTLYEYYEEKLVSVSKFLVHIYDTNFGYYKNTISRSRIPNIINN